MMTGENMVLYLRGERSLDDLKREKDEIHQAREERRLRLLDEKDLELLDFVCRNPDVLKVHLTRLSGRTGVPISTLHCWWKRLQKKKVAVVIRVKPVPDGESLKALSSPSEHGRRAYRKAIPPIPLGDGSSPDSHSPVDFISRCGRRSCHPGRGLSGMTLERSRPEVKKNGRNRSNRKAERLHQGLVRKDRR